MPTIINLPHQILQYIITRQLFEPEVVQQHLLIILTCSRFVVAVLRQKDAATPTSPTNSSNSTNSFLSLRVLSVLSLRVLSVLSLRVPTQSGRGNLTPLSEIASTEPVSLAMTSETCYSKRSEESGPSSGTASRDSSSSRFIGTPQNDIAGRSH